MQGAKVWAKDATYSSSAEVKSMSRVKWFIIASSVAMLFSRNCPRVDCSTLIRGAESTDSTEIGLGVASDVVS